LSEEREEYKTETTNGQSKFQRWVSRFRKHRYERINNAIVQVTQIKGYEIPRYECAKCGRILHLEPWQMKSLPYSMKYNCEG
jgi:hypothetical protein